VFRYFAITQQFFLYLLKFWQARRSYNGPADRGKTDSKPAGNIRTTGGFIVKVCINFQLN
jgi:hypothetical protein